MNRIDVNRRTTGIHELAKLAAAAKEGHRLTITVDGGGGVTIAMTYSKAKTRPEEGRDVVTRRWASLNVSNLDEQAAGMIAALACLQVGAEEHAVL